MGDLASFIEGAFKGLILTACTGLIAWWLLANWFDKTIDLAEAAVGAGLLAIAFLLGLGSIVRGGWGFLGVVAIVYSVLLTLACWEYLYWRQRERQHWLGEIDRYQEALQRDPANAAAYSFLGDACMKVRDYDQAVAAFEKALQLEPESKKDRVLLARAKERQARSALFRRTSR